jgi:hypothetical protein
MSMASKGSDKDTSKSAGLDKKHIAVSASFLQVIHWTLISQDNTSTWAKPC